MPSGESCRRWLVDIALPYELVSPNSFFDLSAVSRKSVGDLTYYGESELRFCPEHVCGVFQDAILGSVLDAVEDLGAGRPLGMIDDQKTDHCVSIRGALYDEFAGSRLYKSWQNLLLRRRV